MRYRKSRSHVQAFLFHIYEVSGFILNPEMGILIVNFFIFVGYFPNKIGNVHMNVTFRRVRETIITVEMQ
jgi:hypothetical protein